VIFGLIVVEIGVLFLLSIKNIFFVILYLSTTNHFN
jgi:hypothetical protein